MHLQIKKNYIFSPNKCAGCSVCLESWARRFYMHKAGNKVEIEKFVSNEFLPMQIVLEVTSRCNVRCKECIHNSMNMTMI